jgi:AraC family transcriptional regulator, activator of mtrCDE
MSIAVSCVRDIRLRRAIACVLDQPSAAHTVAQLAAVASMSRSAFARHFFNSVKQSPMEFVKQVRLQHAASLLRTTDLSVKSVAARTGYASRSHFSRAFRAAFDLDPTHFRKGASDDIENEPRLDH